MKSFQEWFEKPTVEGLVGVTHINPTGVPRTSMGKDELYNRLDITSDEVKQLNWIARREVTPANATVLPLGWDMKIDEEVRDLSPSELVKESIPDLLEGDFYTEKARADRLRYVEALLEAGAHNQALIRETQAKTPWAPIVPDPIKEKERNDFIRQVEAEWAKRDQEGEAVELIWADGTPVRY